MGLEYRTKRLRKVLFRNEWVSSNVELTSALRSDRYLRISEPHQLVLLYARKAVSRQKQTMKVKVLYSETKGLLPRRLGRSVEFLKVLDREQRNMKRVRVLDIDERLILIFRTEDNMWDSFSGY